MPSSRISIEVYPNLVKHSAAISARPLPSSQSTTGVFCRGTKSAKESSNRSRGIDTANNKCDSANAPSSRTSMRASSPSSANLPFSELAEILFMPIQTLASRAFVHTYPLQCQTSAGHSVDRGRVRKHEDAMSEPHHQFESREYRRA